MIADRMGRRLKFSTMPGKRSVYSAPLLVWRRIRSLSIATWNRSPSQVHAASQVRALGARRWQGREDGQSRTHTQASVARVHLWTTTRSAWTEFGPQNIQVA